MIKKSFLVIVSSLLLAACTYTAQPSSTTPPAAGGNPTSTSTVASADITISNFAFSPNSITVKAGQSVSIINNDSTTHTVTSDDGTSFNTNEIAPGATATFIAPSKPGSYAFHCNIHKSMTATLIVQ
ncbi:MAG TPA: cupredoxin domain-containing protein [Patescibacteria group bacterium]